MKHDQCVSNQGLARFIAPFSNSIHERRSRSNESISLIVMVHYDINCAASKTIVREVYPSGFYQWGIQDFPEGRRLPQRVGRQPIILAISS